MIQDTAHQIQELFPELTLRHIEHLISEGFTPSHGFSVEDWRNWIKRGLRSMSGEESEKYGFSFQGKPVGSGLFFPGNGTIGQLRVDNPPVNDKGRAIKYITLSGQKLPPTALLRHLPDGAKVVTEGAKDGEAASILGGILTGHIYGVSHARKHLPKDSGLTVVFDNDGWSNPDVMRMLFNAGEHLKGKINLIPDVPGEGKAGFCEWFKHLHQQAIEQGVDPILYKKQQYAELVAKAYSIKGLLLEWGTRFNRILPENQSKALGIAADFAARHLDEMEREKLAKSISKNTGFRIAIVRTKITKAVAEKIFETPTQEGDEPKPVGIVLTPEQRKRARVKLTYCQEAYKRLFPGNWIYFGKSFYQWVGTHYEEEAIEETTARIHHWCDGFEVVKKDTDAGEGHYIIEYPYAYPKFVKQIREWAVQRCSVPAKKVNPTRAFNCLDGILLLEWNKEERRYDRTLVQHDPAYYFLYAPRVVYNFDPAQISDPTACDRLLDCMEAEEREIVLRTIAASLDVKRVRGKTNRIRALLMYGSGNNGKDTLRGLTYALFGERLTSVALSAFKNYDQGNRFACQELAKASVNWPSETVPTHTLDHIQILKSVISGDKGGLMIEKKGKDGFMIDPNFVNFFNTNELPRLYGAQDAIASRFAIISFKKTYSVDPTGNKLQADTRFMDEDFLQETVISPFFHRILDALDRAAAEGIKYAASDSAFHQARIQTDHIVEFADEVGIDYVPNGYLTTEEVMEKLQEWYQEKGYLEIDPISGKKEWFKPTQFNDECVKGSNQIWARFQKVFNITEAFPRKIDGNRTVYWGLGFVGKTPEERQKAFFNRLDAIKSCNKIEELRELVEYGQQQLQDMEAQQLQQHTIVEQEHAVITPETESEYYYDEDAGSEEEIELTDYQRRLLEMED